MKEIIHFVKFIIHFRLIVNPNAIKFKKYFSIDKLTPKQLLILTFNSETTHNLIFMLAIINRLILSKILKN